MRSLRALTIWGTGAIPADEWKYRNLKRILLPIVDLLFFLGGFGVVRYGVPTVTEFFPEPMVYILGRLLSLAGFLALLGVAFPRLWPFEMIGKSIILGLLVGYFVAAIWLTAVGSAGRGFVIVLDLIAICFVVWRLGLLGNEWQARRVAVKQEAKDI